VSKEIAEAIGLPKPQGALVTQVERDSPAEKAGVEAGDVILRFDGRTIDRATDLPRIVGGTKPGSRVSMSVWRKGIQREMQITVAELPADRAQARRGESPQPGGGTANVLGLVVSDVPAERLKEMRLRGAVQVDSADGAAARAGLRAGDLIVAVNNVEVHNVRQFNDLISKLDPKRNVALLVRRGDQSTFVIIKPSDR
jgi:serine protease Do